MIYMAIMEWALTLTLNPIIAYYGDMIANRVVEGNTVYVTSMAEAVKNLTTDETDHCCIIMLGDTTVENVGLVQLGDGVTMYELYTAELPE